MRALPLALIALLGLAAVASCDDKKKDAPTGTRTDGEKPSPPAAAPAAAVPGEATTGEPTASAEDKAEAECTDWCTLIAGCWEKVNEGEYNAGGECEAACARRPEEERRAYGACVMEKARDCKVMLDC